MRTEYGSGDVQVTVREFTQPDERQRWYSVWYAWIEGEQPSGLLEAPTPREAILGIVERRWRDLGLEPFDRLRIALDRLLHGRDEAGRRVWAEAEELGFKIVLIELPPDIDA